MSAETSNGQTKPRRAWLIPAQEFDEQSKIVKTLEDAKGHADQLIADAERQSDEIIADVTASIDDVVRLAESKVAKKLAADAAEKRESEATLASLELLAVARAIKEDYEAADTWLVDLIMTALRRVFDDMDAEQRAKGLIRAAVAETASRWDLRVKVHPNQAQVFQTLLETQPDALKGVQAILSDDTLSLDDIILESAGGLTQIAHQDQLDHLLAALEGELGMAATC